MICPFCSQEIDPTETTSGNKTEGHCPQCHSIIAAYLKGMEQTLKNLVSMERFEGNAE